MLTYIEVFKVEFLTLYISLKLYKFRYYKMTN